MFAMKNMIGGLAFIDVARVESVTGDTLTIKSLLRGMTTDGDIIENEPVYGVPFLQLRSGKSAVIMTPEVGDIGLIAICDRDITNVKKTKGETTPDNQRSHSYADAVYLTGIASLNSEPQQFAHFYDGGINITSPNKVTINAPSVEVNADGAISLSSPSIILNGPVSQGGGSYQGSADFKNGASTPEDFTAGDISLRNHKTSGVETGSGTSGAPVP